MPDKEDHLSNEVSIVAKFEDAGIHAVAKSRLLAASDRLLGALIDIPTAWLEKKADRIRKHTVVSQGEDTEYLPAETQDAELPITADERLVLTNDAKIENASQAREARKALNKIDVLVSAADELAEDADEEIINDGELSEDWLNYFEEYAEKASSEKVKRLWGRILAGEIRRPKTFSLRTLRFLSELDMDTAQSFEIFVKNRISDATIMKLEQLDSEQFVVAIELEEAGLLQDVNSGLVNNFYVDENQEITTVVNNEYVLRAKTKNSQKISIPVIKISRIGQELIRLLAPPETLKSANTLLDHLIEKEKIPYGFIGKVIKIDENIINHAIVREHKEAEE